VKGTNISKENSLHGGTVGKMSSIEVSFAKLDIGLSAKAAVVADTSRNSLRSRMLGIVAPF